MLRLRADTSRPPVAVVNCHLSAGPQDARRRVQQVHSSLDAYRKLRDKTKVKADAALPVVILAGDFNSQGNTGVKQLLTTGEVLPDFREEGTTEVTSKAKKHALGKFASASEMGYEVSGVPRLPTMVVKELVGPMLDGDAPSA